VTVVRRANFPGILQSNPAAQTRRFKMFVHPQYLDSSWASFELKWLPTLAQSKKHYISEWWANPLAPPLSAPNGWRTGVSINIHAGPNGTNGSSPPAGGQRSKNHWTTILGNRTTTLGKLQ
jgi:hypothetical protein